MSITKKTILELVKENSPLYINALYHMVNCDPRNESDRGKVWRVGQALAELERFGFVTMELVNGQRVYRAAA